MVLGLLAVMLLVGGFRNDLLGGTYKTLQGADKQTLEDLAGLVTVSNVLECLSGVLSADIKENLLSTSVDVLASCPFALY